jgi:GLPGLI family protein
MLRICATLVLLAIPILLHAQFVTRGKIEYERKVNLHRQYEGEEWAEQMKENIPQFYTNFFNLTFTEAKSLYGPGKEVEQQKLGWSTPPGGNNAVYQDYKTKMVTATKEIYEQRFIIEDTLRHLRWRMGNEIRTIAGYKCRKAVTRIYDSVYVVAFYTEDIAVSGGPEQFGGLPGMILELAVPRLYTTWVATKVETIAVKDEDIKAPTGKGKKVNQKELLTSLQNSLKEWGKWGRKSMWWSSL